MLVKEKELKVLQMPTLASYFHNSTPRLSLGNSEDCFLLFVKGVNLETEKNKIREDLDEKDS